MDFIINIGMIASGKSTFSAEKSKEGFLISSDDAIVNCLHANNYTMYKEELKPLYKSIGNQIIYFAAALKKNILIDRTNLDIKTRVRYIQIAKDLGYENIIGIIFPIEEPKIHAERRFWDNPRGFSFEKWLSVAEYHKKIYIEPKIEEGFTKLIYI